MTSIYFNTVLRAERSSKAYVAANIAFFDDSTGTIQYRINGLILNDNQCCIRGSRYAEYDTGSRILQIIIFPHI